MPRVLPILLVGLTACTAQRVVAPKTPSPPVDAPVIREFGLALDRFEVKGASSEDTPESFDAYRKAFLDYLENEARFAMVVDGKVRQSIGPETLSLDVVVHVHHSKSRTWILDVPFFYPAPAFWPLTPLWGDATVEIEAAGRNADDEVVWKAEAKGESGYWMIWYSWYRTAPIQRAYAEASAAAFEKLARQLVTDRKVIASMLRSESSAAVAVSTRSPPPPPKTTIPREVSAAPLTPKPVTPGKDWVVAVMETQDLNAGDRARAADPALMKNLSDQLRVFVAQRGVKVVDRGQQRAAMKEVILEEKKQTYDVCYDESCQIPLGKALAASHILRTKVARFGDACVLNGELIDLTSEVTVAAASARGDCSDEGFLEASQRLTQDLIGGR